MRPFREERFFIALLLRMTVEVHLCVRPVTRAVEGAGGSVFYGCAVDAL